MKLFTAAALAFGAVTSAYADPTTIDFEIAPAANFAPLGNYYNGGTDAVGNVGPSLGVTFGADALGLVNDGTGSGINGEFFTHAPSPVGVMAPVGTDAAMNVLSGFSGAVTLFYSSTAAVNDGIGVWSGLNGSGTELATFNLTANAQGNGCSDSAYCNFSTASLTFSGTAQSVTFGNAANAALFDNVTISAVPEPTGILLMTLGLAGFGIVSRRRS